MTHDEIMEKYKEQTLSGNSNSHLDGYLLQVDENGDFAYDFVFAMAEMDEFYNWIMGIETGIRYNKATIEDIKNRKEGDWWSNCVPVGSIEFVFEYIKTYCPGVELPKPLNVPDEMLYAGKCNRFHLHLPEQKEELMDLIGEGNKFFIKSNTVIKNPDNGLYYDFDFIDGVKNMEDCQVSTYINDIKAEFRCFVYFDKLLDIKRYSGDLEYYPDSEEIKQLIQSYRYDFGHGPGRPAYTLDVALCGEDNHLEVIECHDFYSCGTYGFHCPELTHMFTSTFKFLTRKKII